MGGGTNLRPIVPEAFPTSAYGQSTEPEDPFESPDVAYVEDSLAAWKAVALFGGLVTVEGLLLGGRVPLISVGLLLVLPALPTTWLGYTETTLALLGAAGVGIGVGVLALDSGSLLPVVPLALAAFGVLALAGGTLGWDRALRGIAAEDDAKAAFQSA